MTKKESTSTKERKQRLLAQLAKTPLVQLACQKTGISRATYYVWRNNDSTFKAQADKNIRQARSVVNELAESKLLEQIHQSKPWAIRFWLTHNHHQYMKRYPLDAPEFEEQKALSKETNALLTKALEMASGVLPKEATEQKTTEKSKKQTKTKTRKKKPQTTKK